MTPDINEILARPANKGCSRFGADMGRRSQIDGDPEQLYLQRLQFEDHDYDTGGAYWGLPANLWCAFSPDDTQNDPPIRVFVRGDTREEAEQQVLKVLNREEGWTFFPEEPKP
jgi:hypothetical protein